MENKKTPVSTVVFYIIGIILLIVALFMLWIAVNYTKTYLQTYDASFKDMWTNTVQYVIAQFVPYLGMGVICIGLGRAIKGSANAKVQEASEAQPQEVKETAPEPEAVPIAGLPSEEQLEELARRIDTNREVLSIKIEEKEKRDSFRIKELEKKVEGFLSDVKYINEPLEELVYKQAAGDFDEEPAAVAEEPAVEEVKEVGAVPQIFTVARKLTMPACPAFAGLKAATEEVKEAGAVPQIFTVARKLTMPACPAFAGEEVKEAGAVPQIFTVARRMTMPAAAK